MDIKSHFQRAIDWLTQDSHKQKAVELRDQMERAFTDHPSETGETYLVHLWFTLKMTSRMVATAALLLIHGIFPFLLTRAASNSFERMYQILRSRIPEARRNEINTASPNHTPSHTASYTPSHPTAQSE